MGIAVKVMRWVAGFQVFLLCCPCFKIKQFCRGGGLCALGLSMLLVDDFSEVTSVENGDLSEP